MAHNTLWQKSLAPAFFCNIFTARFEESTQWFNINPHARAEPCKRLASSVHVVFVGPRIGDSLTQLDAPRGVPIDTFFGGKSAGSNGTFQSSLQLSFFHCFCCGLRPSLFGAFAFGFCIGRPATFPFSFLGSTNFSFGLCKELNKPPLLDCIVRFLFSHGCHVPETREWAFKAQRPGLPTHPGVIGF